MRILFKNDKNIEKENEEEQIKKTIDIPISNKENEIKIDDNLIPEDDFSKYLFEHINSFPKILNQYLHYKQLSHFLWFFHPLRNHQNES